MTINTAVPMTFFQDGPRTLSGTVDAAIDARPYELSYVVTGPGKVTHLLKADMPYKNGVLISWDGVRVTLSKLVAGVTTPVISQPGGFGAYTLILDGTSASVLQANGSVLLAGGGLVAAGLRTRYSISGGARVTTQGRLL